MKVWRARIAIGFLVVAALAAASCGGGGNSDDAAGTARVWEPYEITLDDAPVSADNPFDPTQADIWATFISPSGSAIKVTAFVTRGYKRKLVDGKEQLTPDGDLQWNVRFTPTEPGDWTWSWSQAASPDNVAVSEQATLQVEDASSDSHGFLRVSPDDSRYLQFDDGTPYFAIGENLAWYDQRGTYAYDDWFEKLSAVGVNYIRLWMPSWAFGLEWTEPNTLGNYTERLDRAWQLDYVLQQAEKHGIYVLLCLQNHGPFSLTANSEWDKNPYNAANGGPLSEPRDVFTNAEAKQLFERRMRYIVARWGASPNILGWELWNEADLASTDLQELVLPGHEEMSTKLRDLDPYDHLITTSTSLPWGVSVVSATDLSSFDTPLFDFWKQDNIDIAQIHLYALGGSSIDFSDVVPDMTTNLLRFDKPVLLAEAGVNPSGPAETIDEDPSGIGFHDMLWSGLLSQEMGTGMSWWWDNVVDPQDWYYHFRAVSRATKDIDFPREAFAPVDVTISPNGDQRLTALGLVGQTVGIVWIKNGRNQWYSPDRTEIRGASITVPDVPPGTWHAQWVNTYTNQVISESEVDAIGGPPTMNVPAFERDIVLRLDRK